MLERQVVIPASADQLWDALTEPAFLSAWFGSRVDWDLRPGGQARFVDDDGTARCGVIDAVLPGEHLSFRWWRDGDTEDEASRVTYQLEPEEDGTRLTVTEQRVPECRAPVLAQAGAARRPGPVPGRAWSAAGAPETWPRPGSPTGTPEAWPPGSPTGTPGDSIPVSAPAGTHTPGGGDWTPWDTRLFRCWAHASAPAMAGQGNS